MGAILRAIFLREAVAFDVAYLLAEPTLSVSETALAWQMCRFSTPVACFRLRMSESTFFWFATALFMRRDLVCVGVVNSSCPLNEAVPSSWQLTP